MQRSELNSLSEAYTEVVLNNKIITLIEQGKTSEEIQQQLLEEGFLDKLKKGVGDFASAAGFTPKNLGAKVGGFLGTAPAKAPTKIPRTAASTATKKAPTASPIPSPTKAPAKAPTKILSDYNIVLDDIAHFLSTSSLIKGKKKSDYLNMLSKGLKAMGYK
jgi:hypothetical protein